MQSLLKNYTEFLRYSRKSTPQVYFDYLYRELSYPVSYILYYLRLSPNAVSMLAIIFVVIGLVTTFIHSFMFGLLLYMFSYLLDFCDGNIARVRIKKNYKISGAGSHLGEMLESLHANILYLAFILSISHTLYIESGQVFFIYFGFALFGLKMSLRNLRLHASFIEDISGPAKLAPINDRYQESTLVKIKYFFSKVLFTPNCLLALYLIVYIFWNDILINFFLLYSSIEIIYTIVAIAYIMFQISKHKKRV